MANLSRSPRPCNDWTSYHLDSYHISLNQLDPLSFFGLQELPQPSVDTELLTNTEADAMQRDCNAELMHLLELTQIPDEDDSIVDDFVVQLFRVLGYVHRERVARTRSGPNLLICDEYVPAKTHVSLYHSCWLNVLLVVEKYKRLGVDLHDSACARLVVKAISAFNQNNSFRKGLPPPLEEAVIPGIVMDGTSPIFLKIPVTQTLLFHINQGTYPPEETRVTYCRPPFPHSANIGGRGMEPLDARREILRCYEAFKATVSRLESSLEFRGWGGCAGI